MSIKVEKMYQTLELAYGASPEEVKKAYFRLVRKYNPEKEPEKFQEIRAAYETLKDGLPKDAGDTETDWMHWDHPVVGYLIEMADQTADAGDHKHAVDILEDVEKIEPDNPLIKLLMARYLMHAEHWQKAAKCAEEVVQLLPDNMEAWLILANGYHNRGWYKKALPAFRKAYDLGERDLNFLIGYGNNLADNGRDEESVQIFRDALSSPEWENLDPEQALFSYNVIAEGIPMVQKALLEFLDHFDRYIRRHKRFLQNNQEAADPLAYFFFYRENLPDRTVLQRICKSARELNQQGVINDYTRDHALTHITLRSLENDERELSEHWLSLAKAIIPVEDAARVRRFLALDGELCLLKNREQLLKDLPVIRKDYPELYSAYEAFLEQARQEDTQELYKKLKWEFDKLSADYTGSLFEKLYPSEMPKSRKKQKDRDYFSSDWLEEYVEPQEPFVREQEKVGRNDPCPCGSGKKFKKCCMGKGIYD